MPAIDMQDVTAMLDAARTVGPAIEGINLDLDVEVQTDKERVKVIGCRECQRPLVVTTFFAPAKALCKVCRGESPDSGVATVGQPVPGQTDPSKAVDLTKCLVNHEFARAICPVHPEDPEHVMELKTVNHNDHYGPGFFDAKGGWRQTATGETVMHQCLKCLATVSYSTTAVVQFRRMNEPGKPDIKHNNGWARLLGVRED
jgi:hypothetical protein